MKGAQHRDRGNGGAGELGRDVLGDGRQAKTLMCSISPARCAASRSSRL